MNGRRIRGFTLVELVLASALIALFLIFVYEFFIGGRKTMVSTDRKVDAIGATHLRFEEIRHDLAVGQWAWAPALPDEGKKEELKLGGGPMLYIEGREYSFDAATGKLSVAGIPRSGTFEDLRFYGGDDFLVKFEISCDRSGIPATGKPSWRECSTLVSQSFLEPQAAEVRERNHVHEDGHAWCIMGAPIHYGWDD